MGLMELRFMLRKFGVSSSAQSDFTSQPLAGKKFLDVGVGPGRGPVWLSALGGQVTGFDATDKYVEIANSKIEAAQDYLKSPLDVNLIQCPAERFAFPNNYYDGVISLFGVLNHVENWQRTINNIAKSLKGDGQFIFSIYGTNNALVFRLMKEGKLPYEPSILQRRTEGGILLGNSTQVLPANFPDTYQISKVARSGRLKIDKSFGYLRIAALFPKVPTQENLLKFFDVVKSVDKKAFDFISRQITSENILLSAVIYDGMSKSPITDYAYIMFSTRKEII